MSTLAETPFHATYSSTQARTHWRDIMNASHRGTAVTIRRQGQISAVTDAERLRRFFSETYPPHAVSYIENGVHVLVLDGRGFISEGSTLDEAIDDMVLQLREYQEDWDTHYQSAPNHQQLWPLVTLSAISTDAQLRDWLIGHNE